MRTGTPPSGGPGRWPKGSTVMCSQRWSARASSSRSLWWARRSARSRPRGQPCDGVGAKEADQCEDPYRGLGRRTERPVEVAQRCQQGDPFLAGRFQRGAFAGEQREVRDGGRRRGAALW